MDLEAVIIGAASIVWGVILFFTRAQIMEFSREGGKGLRNRKVLGALLKAAIALLLAGGTAVIFIMGF
jgi:hypothetical protein